MIPSPDSEGFGDQFNRPMSSSSEQNPIGFTAVNDRYQNLAVKALDHSKDWPVSNGSASSPYPAYPLSGKRSYREGDSSPEDYRHHTEPTPSISPALPSVSGAQDNRQSHRSSREREWPATPGMEEARMAELLQRETGPHNEPISSNGLQAMNPFDQADGAPGDSASDNVPVITNAGLQVDMKKRKRAFTNRTKTGCQTCRRRKKKCDEGKPACNNCIRGGFTCLGYSQKRDLNSGTKTPHNRSVNAAIAPASSPNQYWDRSEPRGPSFDSNSVSSAPPENRQSVPINNNDQRGPWSGPNFSQNSRPPTQERPTLPPPSSIPSYNREMPMGGPMHSSYSPMPQARKAISTGDMPYPPPSAMELSPPRPTSEAPKYGHLEASYVRDRESCRINVNSLNRALNEGSNRDEVMRRLSAVVGADNNDNNTLRKKGSLGREINIVAPFHADYGHNLHIGDHVFIDRNCTIKDPAEVFIGEKAHIGPNVTISGEFMMPDTKWSSFRKKAVIRIGKNTVISGGVNIYAQDVNELVIGDDVYIAPGLTICQDIHTGSRVYHSLLVPDPAQRQYQHQPHMPMGMRL